MPMKSNGSSAGFVSPAVSAERDGSPGTVASRAGGMTASLGIAASRSASIRSPSRSPGKSRTSTSVADPERDRLLADRDAPLARGHPLAAVRGDARQQARLVERPDLHGHTPERGRRVLRRLGLLPAARSSPRRGTASRPSRDVRHFRIKGSGISKRAGIERRSQSRSLSDRELQWYEIGLPTVKPPLSASPGPLSGPAPGRDPDPLSGVVGSATNVPQGPFQPGPRRRGRASRRCARRGRARASR